MQKTKQIQFFITENGKSYIKDWLEKLDIKTHSRILNRLVQLEYGIYGDYKQIKGRLYELRFFFGKGYRIYFTEKDNKIILLLNAGNKDIQGKDIKKALEIIEEVYKRN
ncbi:type II toxin-antitoxin system RelE/ParE family toxin [Rickettsia helvetica]|uniref:Addiction module killer protein n=1 Tax=Rickettsia helvetica TaxID=35789 RepID=A0ABP0T449_RICHE|nr:type II toxin-antitoxin system RelE/ParE family toxin [Rickettsia helvetica]MCZ6884401.1 type II toxin-antitoxin system RelE/ParE family toxin [Rickettsia endosymbiont of Ixodes ricinus]MCZ6896912.1 type II toxin-antitoxin system RelE/ParE family toxin [Rickettsia endosymbiont of Ixodes ricinus]